MLSESLRALVAQMRRPSRSAGKLSVMQAAALTMFGTLACAVTSNAEPAAPAPQAAVSALDLYQTKVHFRDRSTLQNGDNVWYKDKLWLARVTGYSDNYVHLTARWSYDSDYLDSAESQHLRPFNASEADAFFVQKHYQMLLNSQIWGTEKALQSEVRARELLVESFGKKLQTLPSSVTYAVKNGFSGTRFRITPYIDSSLEQHTHLYPGNRACSDGVVRPSDNAFRMWLAAEIDILTMARSLYTFLNIDMDKEYDGDALVLLVQLPLPPTFEADLDRARLP
jgi:hypothetical protein